MNKTKNTRSDNAFSEMVMRFNSPAFGQRLIGSNAKNSSNQFAAHKKLEEGSNYNYFRFWCLSQNAIL